MKVQTVNSTADTTIKEFYHKLNLYSKGPEIFVFSSPHAKLKGNFLNMSFLVVEL